MSNQSGVQAAIRAITGTTLGYNADWSALFDADGIAAGAWNGRMLAWINATLGTAYADLPGAMHAFAVDQGFTSWSAMNTLELFTPADLFDGYSGDWWTASDLTTLFQDAAGSTPVTAAGDPVGHWLGKVNSTPATQGTAASRPTYRANGYVQPDGSAQFLSAALSITTYPLTLAVVFDGTSAVTGSALGSALSMSPSDTNYRAISNTNAGTTGAALCRGAANTTTSPGKTTPTTSARQSMWALFEAGTATFFFAEGDSGTVSHSNTHGAATFYIGKTRSAGLFSNIKIREALVINRLLDATQRNQLRTYWEAV